MTAGMKTLLLWAALILGIFFFIQVTDHYRAEVEEIAFSEFEKSLEEERIHSVAIQGNEIEGEWHGEDGEFSRFKTYGPEVDSAFAQKLRSHGVEVYEFSPPQDDSLWQLFLAWGPLLLIIILFLVFMRNLQMGGGKAFSFGKSRAKLMREEDKGRITFKDVAGMPESKEELLEIVDFLSEPKRYQKLGGRIPKGVLLMGSPGTGKTLIAKAIAGEANVPFYSISGSDFVEMFVGVGASRVRDLFQQAKKSAPCLVFMDEIDAVGRQRGAGLGGGHDEREQTLNQLLVEMDGFEGKEGIIVIAATNRPDVLDPALLRPGRFDRRVTVPKPELKGRQEILEVHAKKLKLAEDVDLSVIARGTPGFVGADLENICNEAALIAARSHKEEVGMYEFEQAKDKVIMGSERRSVVLSDKEKETTAVHEAGHTLVAKLIPGTDPVHKVTIIPRGMALGVTMQLPEEDRHSMTSKSAHDNIAILMGGRIAEELMFTEVTTGAGNDIEKATELARKMVTEWGMSSRIGPMTIGKKDDPVFLGKEMNRGRDFSEQTAVAIDEEVKRILTENYKRAKQILKDNLDKLKNLASALGERETLDGHEIDAIINGAKPSNA